MSTPMKATEKTAYDKFYAGKLGAELQHKRHVVKGIYSFAVQGGAVGTGYLLDEDGNEIVLPSGTIITQVFTNEVSSVTTSASGTLSFGAASTTDLLGATAAATFAGVQAGIPTGAAANMIALAADAKLSYAIATGALTAGVVHVYVECVYIP
jgi:hypothetical protein